MRSNFRKSWTAYIWPLLWVGIWGYAVFLYLNNWDIVTAKVLEMTETPELIVWLPRVGLFILAFFALRTVWHVLWLVTYKIKIDEYGVHARHGILPWNKWERSWEPAQIFNCLYSGNGFLNWMFRRGNLIVQGSEGVNAQFIFTDIGLVKSACAHVNEIRTGGR